MTTTRHSFDELADLIVEDVLETVEHIVGYFEELVPPGHVGLTPSEVRQILALLLDPTAGDAAKEAARAAVHYQFELAQAKASGRHFGPGGG